MRDTATVLLVDDDPGVADTAAAFVERANDLLTTTTMTSPEAALDRFETGGIDCVVSDYNMPRMDGLALYEAVAAREPEIPFVLFTGKGSEEVASDAISLGVTDYLQKETGTDQYEVLANRITNAIEARRAEQRFERSEERYEQLIESSPAGVVITTLDDSIVYANNAAASFIGADDPADLHGRSTFDLTHPADATELRERWKGIRERESQGPLERRFVGLDGGTRHALVASTPVTYEGDRAMQSVLTDVTDQRRTERELREERKFTERALDTLDDVFYVLDEAGEFVRWNDRLTAVTGYTDEEIAAMHPTEVFVAADRERVLEAIAAVIEAGRASVEARLETKSGERIPYEFTGSRLTDDTGAVVGLCGIGRDSTERLERERDLERYERLVETVDDALYTVDEAGRFSFVNDSFADLTGHDRADLLGSDVSLLKDEATVGLFEEEVRGLLRGDRGETYVEFALRTANGERVPCEDHMVLRTDADGYAGVAGVIRDISERKRRERNLERYETAVEAAPVGVFVLDPGGTVVWANDRAKAAVGHTVGDLTGEPFVSLVEAGVFTEAAIAEYGAVVGDLLSAASDRTTGRYDIALTHPEDGERTMRIHVSLLPHDGEFRGTVLVSEDVTERTARKEQLATQAAAMDTSVDGIAIIGSEGEHTYANEAHADIYGYDDPADLLGMPWSELYTDEEFERIETEDMPAFEERDFWRGEATGLRADGTTFPHELSLSRVDDDRIVGVVRDITTQKRREHALADLHDWTRKMMNTTEPSAVASLAVETAERVLDLSMCGLWLYDDESEALRPAAVTDDGSSVVETVPTYEPGNSLSWEVFETGEAQVYDDVRDADGLNPTTPIRSEMILPLSEYGVINVGSTTAGEFDETEEALARLLATNAEAALERAERERERVANQRLLEHQNERLEAFASVVSHDLRNPLTVASGRLELLGEESDSQHLQPIADALERMDALIEECLVFARQGRLVTDPIRVDIGTVAERAWRTVETGDTDLEVGTLGGVGTDERLRTLFENLFRNAVEHGDATVVQVGPLDERAGFYVADDGPGIAESEREAVFERGYSTGEGGTGLGLAIVDTLAEAHGWAVTVVDGPGARFEVAFEPATALATPPADD